jgi:hypothetical protein
VHGAPPTPDPHRILGFRPDMGRSGEMMSSAAPPRRKAAPKGGVAAAGQPRRSRFPSDTDLLHQNTPEVDPARSKAKPGTGKGCMEGRGAIPPDQAREDPRRARPPPAARRPHGRTPRHAARPASRGRRPWIRGPPRERSAEDPAATFPGARAGFPGGRLWWRRGRKGEGGAAARWIPDRPRVARGATRWSCITRGHVHHIGYR